MKYYSDYFDEAKRSLPYESNEEVKGELLSLLDMLLERLLERRGGLPEGGVFTRGLTITPTELSEYLETPAYLRYVDEKDLALTDEIHRALRHMEERDKLSDRRYPWFYLENLLSMNLYEGCAMLLAYGYQADARYARFYAFLQDDIGAKEPTVGLLRAVYSMIGDLEDRAEADFCNPKKKAGFFLFDFDKNEAIPFLRLRFRPGIYSFLAGGAGLFKEAETKGSAPVKLCENLIKSLYGLSKENQLMSLKGEDGLFKELIIKSLCEKNKLSPVIFDASAHEKKGYIREVLFKVFSLIRDDKKPVVFIKAADDAFIEGEGFKLLKHYLKPEQVLIFIDSKTGIKEVLSLEIASPNVEERIILWDYFLNREGLKKKLPKDISIEEISDCYEIDAALIESAVLDIRQRYIVDGGKLNRAGFLEVLMNQSQEAFGHLASRIKSVYGLDDLQLPEDQKDVLLAAVGRYKIRNRIETKWGLAAKNAYGNGVSLILSGPPGTGKTMAAQVVAGQLGLPLYRVDLSQLTSKYIGDTEKNIDTVFEKAGRGNLILFFDEADALFAKRTEVDSSHDRHANAQTAYMLQKIEEYRGFTILATNLYQNFDPAFMRRITYSVRFINPDAEIRRKIWESVIPEAVPRDEELRLDILSEDFELSGSNIKAIVNSAIYIAAAEGVGLKNTHIARAMKYEFDKLGKLSGVSQFGRYSVYLQ